MSHLCLYKSLNLRRTITIALESAKALPTPLKVSCRRGLAVPRKHRQEKLPKLDRHGHKATSRKPENNDGLLGEKFMDKAHVPPEAFRYRGMKTGKSEHDHEPRANRGISKGQNSSREANRVFKSQLPSSEALRLRRSEVQLTRSEAVRMGLGRRKNQINVRADFDKDEARNMMRDPNIAEKLKLQQDEEYKNGGNPNKLLTLEETKDLLDPDYRKDYLAEPDHTQKPPPLPVKPPAKEPDPSTETVPNILMQNPDDTAIAKHGKDKPNPPTHNKPFTDSKSEYRGDPEKANFLPPHGFFLQAWRQLHLYRRLLRESSYLPDAYVRESVRRQIIHAFHVVRQKHAKRRIFMQPSFKRSVAHGERKILVRGVSTCRAELNNLQRANAGHPAYVLKIFRRAYGRLGHERYAIANKILLGYNPFLAQQVSQVAGCEPVSVPPKRNYQWMKVSAALEALIEAHMQQNSDKTNRPFIKGKFPENNKNTIWGRPLPLQREQRQQRFWYNEVREKLLPPLPPQAFDRLLRLASGAEAWGGSVPRRKPAKSDDPVHKDNQHFGGGPIPSVRTNRDLIYSELASQGEQDAMREASNPILTDRGLSRPHEFTPRSMRRLYTLILAQTPKLEWHPLTLEQQKEVERRLRREAEGAQGTAGVGAREEAKVVQEENKSSAMDDDIGQADLEDHAAKQPNSEETESSPQAQPSSAKRQADQARRPVAYFRPTAKFIDLRKEKVIGRTVSEEDWTNINESLDLYSDIDVRSTQDVEKGARHQGRRETIAKTQDYDEEEAEQDEDMKNEEGKGTPFRILPS